MTQEDKELLLKDLCARLPYGVKIKVRGNDIRTVRMVDIVEKIVHFVESDSISPFGVHIEHPITFQQVVKPYLRPMSSMTEEEKQVLELCNAFVEPRSIELKVDFYNKQHLDYRGLIEKGLAIEITEENNPYKE